MKAIFSKTLTHRHAHLFDALADTRTILTEGDYYVLGYPVINPARVRGSMVLLLNDDFITDNVSFVDIVSPFDRGGVQSGMLELGTDKVSLIEQSKTDIATFQAFLIYIRDQHPSLLSDIMAHKHSKELADVMRKYFPAVIVEAMLSSHNPHAWYFEFRMGRGYTIKVEHIASVLVPNTYRTVIARLTSAGLVESQIVCFNPKFGYEYIIANMVCTL
jgi:hypothetical protein